MTIDQINQFTWYHPFGCPWFPMLTHCAPRFKISIEVLWFQISNCSEKSFVFVYVFFCSFWKLWSKVVIGRNPKLPIFWLVFNSLYYYFDSSLIFVYIVVYKHNLSVSGLVILLHFRQYLQNFKFIQVIFEFISSSFCFKNVSSSTAW